MIGLYYLLGIITISIVLGEIHYRYLLKSKRDKVFVIERNWKDSIDKDFGDLGFNDNDIKEAISCEMTQML